MSFDEYTLDDLVLKRRSIRRQLSVAEGLQPVRVAVLGGSTTNELVDLLEILLLSSGFTPALYQSDYNRFYEEAVLEPSALIGFAPEIVYLHTSYRNLRTIPSIGCSESELQNCVQAELGRFQQIWRSIEERVPAQIIQNNFELPPFALLGNLDAVSSGGLSRFITELNAAFARESRSNPKLLLQDVHSLAARMGLDHWFDWKRWFGYKILTSVEANLATAKSLASIVRAIYGKSRKVLVLDLDNTVWGGVIGDDGPEHIQIGRETPVAEAYTAFQEYCLSLRNRGVLLAACSKNNEEIARRGFQHPDSVLKLEHFSSFKVNWEPKHENVLAIAKELNVGVESLVFVDDNPAERLIVRAQIPGVAVPDVGEDVSGFIAAIEAGRYFEPVSLSHEDLSRAALYEVRAAGVSAQAQFADYGEYLDSLSMSAEIGAFREVYLERIAQLTNKTNQFNLTTRRYTLAEMEMISRDGEKYITLYGRLSDRFGDNGLISVVVGRRAASILHLDLWLMSCRVLKRDMELAMLDAVIEDAAAAGIETLLGYYIPTPKNGMVADHYQKLGFEQMATPDANSSSAWKLRVAGYLPRNRHIKVQRV